VSVRAVWWPRLDPSKSTANESFPSLFEEASTCPQRRASEQSAQRIERAARLHAERYPYDPEAGVRATHLLMQSGDCYRALGAEADARRVQSLATELRERIDTDYASSRLVLDRALRLARWELVDQELQRLLAMTRHLREGAYVRWLRETAGKVATHARPTR
jgi:hypothetical protein